jgi:uncharacterized protein (DUF1800 family)
MGLSATGEANLALHRFGLGPRPGSIAAIQSDPRGALLAELARPRWFSVLQGQSLSGASFTTVRQLQEHIDAFIRAYNSTAQPFAWTKKKVHQRRFKGRRSLNSDSEY